MVFACCRATSLSCPVVSCQSSVTMRVLVRLMVIAVVGGIPVAGVFLEVALLFVG